MQGIVNHLLNRYEGRDQGVPDKLIGVALMVTDNGTKLDQAPYTKSIVIERMCSFFVRNVSTPLEPGMDLSPRPDDKQKLNTSSFPCARNLGKHMLLAGMTRPDISCSVRELSRRVTSPFCMRHWRGLEHVLRYLAGTLDVGINYKKSTDDDINTEFLERFERLLGVLKCVSRKKVLMTRTSQRHPTGSVVCSSHQELL